MKASRLGPPCCAGSAGWGRVPAPWLATAAGLLHPGDLDHLDLRRDHVEQFADILADHAQIAAAIGTGITGVKLATLARRVL